MNYQTQRDPSVVLTTDEAMRRQGRIIQCTQCARAHEAPPH